MDGDWVPIVVALFGGGTIATLAGLVLHYRAENTRTLAEAGKVGAEGEAVVSDSVQRRYDALFDDLEKEIVRRQSAEAECREALATTRKELDKALSQIARLRVEAANATADVKLARSEIVRLQDHLDALEHKVNRRSTP